MIALRQKRRREEKKNDWRLDEIPVTGLQISRPMQSFRVGTLAGLPRFLSVWGAGVSRESPSLSPGKSTETWLISSPFRRFSPTASVFWASSVCGCGRVPRTHTHTLSLAAPLRGRGPPCTQSIPDAVPQPSKWQPVYKYRATADPSEV